MPVMFAAPYQPTQLAHTTPLRRTSADHDAAVMPAVLARQLLFLTTCLLVAVTAFVAIQKVECMTKCFLLSLLHACDSPVLYDKIVTATPHSLPHVQYRTLRHDVHSH
uniref:Uncharacterized protein n=1 Tax=Lygus hesperus TaxID=30085 RepID=A0A146LQL1_LYGHE